MIARQRTDYSVLFIQNWIAAETALDYGITDIIQIIGQMEILQVLCTGDPADRNRLENQTGGTVRAYRAYDQTGGT